MDQLRRMLATIHVSLSKLTLSQRLLIGSVVVVMLMTLFFVQQYASKPGLVPLLPDQSPKDQAAAAALIQTMGVKYENRDGQIYVPASQETFLLAQLTEQNFVPSNGQVMFDNLIDKQSWTMTQRQNDKLETIAVQNELNKIITHMSGVRWANTILHIPSKQGGLGRAAEQAHASATVMPTVTLDQATVDSVASLIAASRGIPLANVRVIDAKNNRQWKPRAGDDYVATTAFELAAKMEQHKREQLYEMLSYIKGVIISVQAQVDVTTVHKQREHIPAAGKGSESLVISETSREEETTQPAIGGSPGVRSNTGLAVEAGLGGGGGGTSVTETMTDFEARFGSETERTTDPRGHAKKMNAVVNIPRAYFVRIWRSGRTSEPGEEEAQPTDEELDPIKTTELARIKTEVEKMVDTSAGDGALQGEVEVSMIPVAFEIESATGQSAGSFLGGAGGGTMQATLKTVGLGLLAVISLLMIVLTALKAAKHEPLPSVQDIVGLPPAMESEGDLVGEAVEAESQLEGLELSEDDIRRRKQLEQVADLVNEKPNEAATMLNKWMADSA